MKKKLKKIIKKMSKMGFLEDLKMSLLNFNFAMIYLIHKILVLLQNHLNYLKDNISKCFLRIIINFYFLKKFFFSQHIKM